jgi:hypothetical protein
MTSARPSLIFPILTFLLLSTNLTPEARAQIDPRIPIPASREPAPPFEIDEPGSYRLTGNRRCASDGIRVLADDVTIDLMGFTLGGSDTGATVGIYMNGRQNVEVRHGTIRGFGGRGIHDRNESGAACGKRIIDLRVIANGGCGICLGGDGNLIRDCFVSGNRGTGACTSGILQGNVFLDNATGGIACGDRSLVLANTVIRTAQSGIFARAGCTIRDNNVSGADRSGIYAEQGSLVEGNVVTDSNRSGVAGYAGIKVIGDCIVRGNSARSNRVDNILVLRSGVLLEGNLATAASDTLGSGISLLMKENYVTGNCVSGNSNDFTGETPEDRPAGSNVALPRP